jgi:hypothetical protein
MTKTFANTCSHRDLIDLAVEYAMIRSTFHFTGLNAKQQAAVIRQMNKIAEQLPPLA